MNLILHQIVKDLRAQRWPLALWLAVLLIDGLFRGLQIDRFIVGAEAANRLYVVVMVVGYAELVLGWLIAVKIIQADPLDTTTAFWLTRPLSRPALLVSKLLVIGPLFLLLPCAASTSVAATHGVRGITLLHFAVQRVTIDTALLLPVTAMAAVTRDFPRFAFGVAVAALLYVTAQGTALMPFSWVVEFRAQQPGLVMASGRLVALGASIVGSLLLLVHQYATRRTMRTILAGAAMVVVIVGIINFWPWSFWSRTRSQPPAVDPLVFDAAPVKLEFDTASLRRGDGSQGQVEAQCAYRAEGLPVGWVAHVAEGGGELRFATAPSVAVPIGEVSAPYFGSDLSRSLAGDVVGAFEHALGARIVNAPTEDGNADVRLLRLAEATFQRFQGVRAEYSATLTLLARRVEAGPAIPLRAGASGVLGNVQVTVVSVDRWNIQVRETKPALFLPWGEPEIRLALRNRRRNEAILLARHNGTVSVFGVVTSDLLVTRSETGVVNADGIKAFADAQWMADAELVMFAIQPVGTFQKTVRISGLVLPQMGDYRK